MKYSFESQEKALRYLIKNEPHDIEKFENLYNVNTEDKARAEIKLRAILFSRIWNADEKVRLIKLYGHDDFNEEWVYKTGENEFSNLVDFDGLSLIDECIKKKSFSGVQALLELENNISVATILIIIKYIKDPKERYKYCELIVEHYKNAETIEAYKGTGNQCYLRKIPSLCDCYPEYWGSGYSKRYRRTVSSMEAICNTNDLELVKLFLPTVKDIRPLFTFAVKTGNIEMVKLFIENGADVNFQYVEFGTNECVFETPLKVAIENNDLEMVKFLYKNGADLNFVAQSEEVQKCVNNIGYNEQEDEKEGLYPKHSYDDRWNYISWIKPPLEYAIKSGTASILEVYQFGADFRKSENYFEKQYESRVAIVKYLYENGAVFQNGEINYTDLICFAIKSDDFKTTKYFFDEALKNGSHLDFTKIISFIHEPGVIKISPTKTYCYFESLKFSENERKNATPWFEMCIKYSKKIDSENHFNNVKKMLELIFQSFPKYVILSIYKKVITELSNELPKDMLKEIPAVVGMDVLDIEEILKLGYDINSIDNNENNVLMDYLQNSRRLYKEDEVIETIDKLISLGLNPNYQSSDGRSALSIAIDQLTKCGFIEFSNIFNSETGKLFYSPEVYEQSKKAIVKKLIELSSQDIIMSDAVEQSVYSKITPGYAQIIYNEILEELVKKGFKVDDDYFAQSITFLNEQYLSELITNPWEYLQNLYKKFPNKTIETNQKFPKIEAVTRYKYGTKGSNNLFALIVEHLKRNFATSIDEICDPNRVINEKGYWIIEKSEYEPLTDLKRAQDKLLDEISRYIGKLDYRQIIILLDSFPLIDEDSIKRNEILARAIDAKDTKLCEELIKRGFSIVCYDSNGHDVTTKRYGRKRVKIFQSLVEGYTPDKEYVSLLSEIGCDDGGAKLSKKIKAPSEANN